MRTARLVSVVAPMLNEEGVAEEFHRRVSAALAGIPHEIVIVDDGSSDRTPEILDDLAARDPHLRVIHLSRAFGHQMALTAGLDHARGDAIVMMDADLQDPPELIPELLAAWEGGGDVVVAKRRERAGETRFKLLTAKVFYALIRRLSQVELEANAGDFRLLDRAALDALLALRERSRYLRGMSAWIGFTHRSVHYDRDPRFSGETKYPFRKMLRFAIDGVSSFSNFPLQLASYLGFLTTLVAFLGLPLVVVARYVGIFERGVPTVLFAILFLGGIQLMTLGVIGEYVGRIYDEAKRRPLYIVRSRVETPPDDGRDPAGAGAPHRVDA